jgi:hypothetical protein
LDSGVKFAVQERWSLFGAYQTECGFARSGRKEDESAAPPVWARNIGALRPTAFVDHHRYDTN